jgi:hypothetical protein
MQRSLSMRFAFESMQPAGHFFSQSPQEAQAAETFMPRGAADENKPKVTPTGHHAQKALPRSNAVISMIISGTEMISVKTVAPPESRVRSAPIPRPKVEMGSRITMSGVNEKITPAATSSGIA